jgi:hypothetical protein
MIRLGPGLTALDAIDGGLEVRHENVAVGRGDHETLSQAFISFDDNHPVGRVESIVPTLGAKTRLSFGKVANIGKRNAANAKAEKKHLQIFAAYAVMEVAAKPKGQRDKTQEPQD